MKDRGRPGKRDRKSPATGASLLRALTARQPHLMTPEVISWNSHNA